MGLLQAPHPVGLNDYVYHDGAVLDCLSLISPYINIVFYSEAQKTDIFVAFRHGSCLFALLVGCEGWWNL